MKQNQFWTLGLCLLVGLAFAPGCEPGGKGEETATTSTDDHDHDHAHDHGEEGHDHDDHDHEHEHEEMGDHGGHLAKFDDGGLFEWAHNDAANLVTIFVLGDDKKSLAPVAYKKAVITAKSGDKVKEFELNAADEADGKAATFSLEDPALIAALQLGVELTIETDEATHHAVIKPHVH